MSEIYCWICKIKEEKLIDESEKQIMKRVLNEKNQVKNKQEIQDFEDSMVEHNVIAVSMIYCDIALDFMAELLGLTIY